jgi:peptide deformylase
MAILDIRIYNDPVLRERALPIDPITARHVRLARDMMETMYSARGIGLAANQVGLTERIVVVDVHWPAHEKSKEKCPPPLILLNPEVLETADKDDVCSEGCLSLPQVEGDVWRAVWVRYRYQDLEGKWHEKTTQDLEARCILHEIDHLDGVLFLDRMRLEERRKLAGKLAALRKTRSGKDA